MVSFQGGLGKGLEALIPKFDLSPGKTIINVEPNKIIPNPRQPRTGYNEDILNELALSIKEHGIAQPIIVRQKGNVYELIAGERRWRAAQKAGLSEIPVIVKEVSDKESLELALIENLHREDLHPLEEAEGYKNIIEEFDITQEELSKGIGKNRSTIANTLRLLTLPDDIKQSLRENKISAGHARALLSTEDPEKQRHALKLIIGKNLNVRETERLLKIPKNVSRETSSQEKFKTSCLEEASDSLEQFLGTKVEIKGTTKKGKIEIYYFSEGDLDRVLKLITPKTDS